MFGAFVACSRGRQGAPRSRRGYAYRHRSRAVQEAIRGKLQRLQVNRLARECAKLDPEFEKALADEGLNEILGA